MDKHKFYTCEFCGKEFRSDNLKRHRGSCEKKQNNARGPTTLAVRTEVHIPDSFIITEAEAESDGEDPEVERATTEDEAFIDNEEIRETTNEVAERLAWLHRRAEADRVGYTACIHCKVYILDSEIEKHSKNCAEKLLKCYKCDKQYPAKVIKKHYNFCTVNKKKPRKPVHEDKTKAAGGNGSTRKQKGTKRRRKTNTDDDADESVREHNSNSSFTVPKNTKFSEH